MKKTQLLWSILIIFSIINASFAQQRPPQNTGEGMYISNGQLYDETGTQFIIRGVNNTHAWVDGCSTNGSAYKALDNISSVGVNAIRIVWGNQNNPWGLNNSTCDDHWERIIEEVIANDMIPIVSMWDGTGNNDPNIINNLVSWYIARASTLNKPGIRNKVIINIANEWGRGSLQTVWRDTYKNAITRLRNAGLKQTIILDQDEWAKQTYPMRNWGQELLNHDPERNIGFGVHYYCGPGENGNTISNDIDYAKNNNLYLLVGEFADQHPPCGQVDEQTVLNKCNATGTGYLHWAWINSANNDNSPFSLVTNWEYPNAGSLTSFGRKILTANNGITANSKKAGVFTGETPPPTDADLLTNGDFSSGLSGWNFLAQGTNSSAAVENGEARINVNNAGTAAYQPQLVQGGFSINSGVEYTITFDAKASANRTMELYLSTGPGNYIPYVQEVVNLTTSMRSFSYTFTASTSDSDARVDFNLGGAGNNDATLDNISLKVGAGSPPAVAVTGVEVSPANRVVEKGQSFDLDATVLPANAANSAVNWSSSNTSVATVDALGRVSARSAGVANITVTTVDGGFTASSRITVTEVPITTNIVSNGNFSSVLSPWELLTQGTNSSARISNGRAVINVQNAGNGRYQPQLVQDNIKILNGETYTVSFRARSNTNRTMELFLSTGPSAYTPYIQRVVNLSPSWNTFTFSFTAQSTDNNARIDFNCGGDGNGNVILDDVVLSAESNIGVPVSGISISPPSLTLIEGESLRLTETVTPSNATNKGVVWSSGNSTIASVNANGRVSANNAGTTTITATTIDGGFTANTQVVVNPLPPSNILINGDFSDDIAPWVLLSQGTNSSARVVNGEALITVSNAGNGRYQPQLVQDGFEIINGESYTISFSARSNGNRTMELYFSTGPGAYTPYIREVVNLTSEMKDFSFDFTANSTDNNARIDFNCGGDGNNDVVIDDVLLVSRSSSLAARRTGVSSIKPESTKVYPNPVSITGNVNVFSKGIYSVSIHSILGEEVYAASEVSGVYSINVARLGQGHVFIITIIDGQGSLTTHKLIKK